MIYEKQDGDDLVWIASDRQFGGADTEALRMNGTTGKLTLSGGAAMPATLLQDSWDKPRPTAPPPRPRPSTCSTARAARSRSRPLSTRPTRP